LVWEPGIGGYEGIQGAQGKGDGEGNVICHITTWLVWGHKDGGVSAYCIAMFKTEIKILDIKLQIRKDKLLTLKAEWRRAQGARVS
jgi:hypothetical protein